MTTKMLGQLCVTKFQNLSNLCIEHVQKHVQKHQIETVVSTLKRILTVVSHQLSSPFNTYINCETEKEIFWP